MPGDCSRNNKESWVSHMKKDSDKKAEIVVKKDAKAEAMKRAPDEVIARAIHDALLKEHEKKK